MLESASTKQFSFIGRLWEVPMCFAVLRAEDGSEGGANVSDISGPSTLEQEASTWLENSGDLSREGTVISKPVQCSNAEYQVAGLVGDGERFVEIGLSEADLRSELFR